MPRTLRELFVNRTRQTEAFRKMLDGQTSRRIMLLTAGPGMGKSWLCQIFAQEAVARGLPLAQVDFADGQAYDPLLLVRRCRDAFGGQHFNAVTQAINDATAARLEVAASAAVNTVTIAPSAAGAISGTINAEVGTIVKDNLFVLQADTPIARQALEDRINTAFFECLAALCQQQKAVFLFDTYERASLEPERWAPGAADRWVSGQLLARIREGRLTNAIAVLSGRRAPEFGAEWNDVLGRMSLDVLDCADIRVYLRERRGLAAITDAEADRLCQAVAGVPQVLGLIGDNLELANAPKSRDDEW
jgi:hypothetical protein